ncbi:MAG: glycosyltransferase family 39 protein [Armatimonadota bacterium]
MGLLVSRRRSREIHRQSGSVAARGWRYAPFLILGLHLALALIYNARTPFGNNGYANTPDEGAHFQYVEYVAQEWRLPRFEGYAGVGYEAHQPPLYYFLAALLYHLVGGAGKGVRLLSTLASAGVVWLVWLTLRRLLPHRPEVALTGMGFVAFLPMHIAIGSAVGNDALTNLLFASVLYGLVAEPLRCAGMRQAVLIGILTGLALLTKATAILLLPVVVLGLLLKARRDRVGWAQGLRQMGIALSAALFISGWWFIRNAILYDDPLLQRTFLNVFAGTAKAEDFLKAGLSWGEYLRWVANWTFRSFWFAYGTPRTAATGVPNFLPFEGVYLAMGAWQLLTLMGLVLALRKLTNGKPPTETTHYSPLTIRLSLLLSAFTFGLVLLSFLLFIRVFFQAQGRYFYPALLPIATFHALGWDGIVGLLPARWHLVGHLCPMLFWLLLAIACALYL